MYQVFFFFYYYRQRNNIFIKMQLFLYWFYRVVDFLFFFFKYVVEGIIGLFWGFGLSLFDVIRGIVVDYMYCVCEGVIDQLILRWFDKLNLKFSFYLGFKVEEISKELTVIILICEIIRILRSLVDVKDWKGNEYFIFKIRQIDRQFYFKKNLLQFRSWDCGLYNT